MSRWYRTILIAVAVLVLLLSPRSSRWRATSTRSSGLDLTLAERAALVVGATVVIGSFLLYIAWHAKEGPAIGATLQGTAAAAALAAALASALYLGSVSGPLATENIDEWAARAGDRAAQALLVGSGLAGALWSLRSRSVHLATSRRRVARARAGTASSRARSTASGCGSPRHPRHVPTRTRRPSGNWSASASTRW